MIKKYLLRRLLYLIPQIIGVVTIIFIIVRLIPGDPARIMAGSLVSEEGVQLLRERMGFDGTLLEQYINYFGQLLRGDLGDSWVTGNTVLSDIIIRLPATLELIVITLLVTFFIILPLGMKAISIGQSAIKKYASKGVTGYGMAAGAFPDFWLALILIFVFYSVLGWAPAPNGRIDVLMAAPTFITGSYLIDSLLTGNWSVFISSLQHLILPVFVLSFVYGGGILKIALVSAQEVQKSEYINFAMLSALPIRKVQKYINKAIYPSVATYSAVIFGFLIGGAVLVETVFSWRGFGQYAVNAVVNSDYMAIQGVVLVAALLNLLVYTVIDLIYFKIDPRIKELG